MNDNINQTVDLMKDEVISFLQKLVRIPSENPDGDYEEVITFLKTELISLGFEVEVIHVPEEVTKKQGLKTPRKNIIATMKGSGDGRHLLFNSHIDTVPADNPAHWVYPPFDGIIADGKLYGRGATDSKGRLTAYIMSAVALKRSGIPFKGDISIVATCDEETGGLLGAGYVNENKLVSGNMVVVEGYSDKIVRAMAGVLQLKIIAKGKPAHAGFKWKGINAVEKITKVIQGLETLQKELQQSVSQIPGMNYTTINIGTIKGGTKINVVPGNCEIEVDFRVTPEYSLDDIYKRVENIVENLEKGDNQFNVVIERITDFETEPTVTREDSPLIEEIQKANEEVKGERLPVVGMLGQSDSRWFINNGIPAINFGPGTSDNNLHGYDEFMDLENLLDTTKVLTVLARNYTR